MTSDVITDAESRVFAAWVRCDACAAQALVRVVLADNRGELTLCGHHARQHASALTLSGAVLLSDTPQLFT